MSASPARRASAVYLLRHGRTASNASGTWQGQADVPLDEVGVVEAERTAAVLAALAPPPSRIVSSDLSRARATAQALGRAVDVEVETDERLREVFAGTWEGLTRTEIEERWPEELEAWKAGEDLRIGGGERISEAGARFATAFREHAAGTDGVLVLVSHGGALRSAVEQVVGVPNRVLGRLRNAHWAVLVPSPSDDDGWLLEAWNAGPDPL